MFYLRRKRLSFNYPLKVNKRKHYEKFVECTRNQRSVGWHGNQLLCLCRGVKTMGDKIIDYRVGISNKMIGSMLDSDINPTTGKPFANEEAKQTWMKNYDKPVEKQSKGFFKRLKDALFAHGGPVKKKHGSYMGGGKVHRKEYAKGGGVRKAARYS